MGARDFITMEDILNIHPVPPYLTPTQVGKLFQEHPSTIRRGCEAGKYRKAFKDGPKWLIPSRYLEQQIREAEANGEFGA